MAYDADIIKGKKALSNDKNIIKNLVMISDFHQKNSPLTIDKDSLINYRLVQLHPENKSNTVIDSAYISKSDAENIELTVTLKNQGQAIETLPVSLYNTDNLVAKSSVAIKDKAATNFIIPINTTFDGKLTIEDTNLQYDNSLYFNLDKQDKIKVLSVNETDDAF